MQKNKEISDPKSCFNKATDDELLFILLSRDPAAGDTIRYWIRLRISMGLNKPTDEQIKEALSIARQMDLKPESK